MKRARIISSSNVVPAFQMEESPGTWDIWKENRPKFFGKDPSA